MTSGAATMLGPSAVVIGLAPTGPARAAMAELLGHAAQWGADIVEVGPEALARDRPSSPSRPRRSRTTPR